MSNKATIRVSGNAIEISLDGLHPLPSDITKTLELDLQYKQITMTTRADNYHRRIKGVSDRVKITNKKLYIFDKYQRMICGIGLLDRVSDILKSNKYNVNVIDITPIHPRHDRYKEDWDNLVEHVKFRAKQEELLIKIASNPRGIINAATGVGKSFLLKAIALLYPNARIIITTKRKDIALKLRTELIKDIPNVGIICSGQSRKIARVTVVSAGSLHHINPDDCDILLADEGHELCAPTYANKLGQFKYCRMYAFTATPQGRGDNTDIRLESLFGREIFRLEYQEAQQLNLVKPIVVRWVYVNMPVNPAAGKVDVPKQRWGLWRNEIRNKIIAKVANEFDKDTQVLIMVTRLEHAVYLKHFLPDFTLCYSESDSNVKSVEWYKERELLPDNEPTMTAQRRDLLRTQFEKEELKKIIATDVWSTGVSFDSLAVLIRADARKSTIMDSQIPGRVCRIADNKDYGLVIDCFDAFDPSFRSASLFRRKNYQRNGWKQIDMIDQPRLIGYN